MNEVIPLPAEGGPQRLTLPVFVHVCRDRARWPLWSCKEFLKEEGFRAQYPSLHQELVIEDTYLGPILEGDVDLGGTTKIGPLLEALEVSIQGSLNVLQHLSLRNEAKDDELDELRRSQEVLLKRKQDALDALLIAHPEFAWRRNRLLGGRVRRKRLDALKGQV